MRRKILWMLALSLLISVGTALAKGTPDKVVISSASLPSDIVISSDGCTLNALGQGSLEDLNAPVSSAPQVTGSGYLISRYLQGQVLDQLRYYDDPAGGRGYVYEVGGVESPWTGQWFRTTAQAEFVVNYLLTNPSELPPGVPDKVIVSGPGLPHSIEIDDACMLDALAMGNLEDPTMQVKGTPETIGYGYLITRYKREASGDYQAFDQVHFYVDPRGGYGYVYDLGGSGSTEAGQWFRPTAFSEAIMETMILNPSGYDTAGSP